MNARLNIQSLKKIILVNIFDFFTIEELSVIRNISKKMRDIFNIKHKNLCVIYKHILSQLSEYITKASLTCFNFNRLSEELQLQMETTHCHEEDKVPIMFNLLYKIFSAKDYILIDFNIDDFTAHFLSFMLKCGNLTFLKIMSDFKTTKAVNNFLSGIEKTNTLHQLSINYCTKHKSSIIDALQLNKSINKLDLSVNELQNENICSITHLLRTRNNLIYLNLSSNGIDGVGLKHLCGELASDENLQSLNLGGNQISDDGVKIVAEMLQKNKSIVDICLNYNKITFLGLAALIEAGKVNSTLKELHLSGNVLGSSGGDLIASNLGDMSITLLNVRDNLIGTQSICRILEALLNCTCLKIKSMYLSPVSPNTIVKELGQKLKDKLELDINVIKYA